MPKSEILTQIASDKVVEQMLYSMKASVGEDVENLRDLIGDIYLIICEMEDEKLINLYNNKQLNFYISRIIMNQLCSQTSPYYVKYKKFKTVDISKLPL